MSREKKEKTPIFLVLEGLDGAGKTTLARALCQALSERKLPVSLFQEPTRYETGQKIRRFLKGELELNPKDELELFFRDRKESVTKNILPALESGNHVILDRYYYSTAAYQWKSGLPPEKILEANQNQGFPPPDKLVYLDIPVTLALERIRSKESQDIFETQKELETIRERYLRILPPETIVLDATLKTEDLVEILLPGFQ